MNLVRKYINNKLKYYRTCNLEFQVNPELLHEFIYKKSGVWHSVLSYSNMYGYDPDGIYITFHRKNRKILYNYYHFPENSIKIQESLDWHNISLIEHLLVPYRNLDDL